MGSFHFIMGKHTQQEIVVLDKKIDLIDALKILLQGRS